MSGAASLHAGRRAPARWALDSWAIQRDPGDMDDKAIRRKTREFADQAYEEELRRGLAPLAEAFERWKAGAATSVEISDLIHESHQGPSRRLRGMYIALKPAGLVARAVARGVLARKSQPPEVAASVADEIKTFEQLARDEP